MYQNKKIMFAAQCSQFIGELLHWRLQNCDCKKTNKKDTKNDLQYDATLWR